MAPISSLSYQITIYLGHLHQGRRLRPVGDCISGREACLWDILLTTHVFATYTALPHVKTTPKSQHTTW